MCLHLNKNGFYTKSEHHSYSYIQRKKSGVHWLTSNTEQQAAFHNVIFIGYKCWDVLRKCTWAITELLKSIRNIKMSILRNWMVTNKNIYFYILGIRVITKLVTVLPDAATRTFSLSLWVGSHSITSVDLSPKLTTATAWYLSSKPQYTATFPFSSFPVLRMK